MLERRIYSSCKEDAKFYTFVTKKIMAEITISNEDWERLKLKVKRKYRELTAEDLQYTAGEEEKLILHLMDRLRRNREYVVFTLRKGLVNIDNNRL